MTPLLIVEDEAVVAGTMEKWLAAAGYPAITQAKSAEEALDAVTVQPPAVAICDVGLPGNDGLWLVEQLRQRSPSTAIVLATGRDCLPAEFTLRDGVTAYLLKPFGRDHLRDAVASAVEWHAHAARMEAHVQIEREARDCRRVARAALGTDPITNAREAWAAFDRAFTDSADREHAMRVACFALDAADRLSLPDLDRASLEWAARFHDLGRLTVPPSILTKPAELTAKEMIVVRRAPSEAFEMLLDHPFLADAGYLIRSIRERADGRGYPDGLAGHAIPVGSRIIAAADALDVIAHDQAYRAGRSPADAALEMLRCAGTQFDATVVQAVLEAMAGEA